MSTTINNEKPFTFRFIDAKPRILLELKNTAETTLRSIEILTIFLKDEEAANGVPSQAHIRFDAVKAMGLKNPIGQIVKRENDHDWEVVGVVKDFILESPFESRVNPMMITGPTDFFQVIHFKLNPANTTEENIAKAESIFTKYNPDYPFEYVFVD